MERKDGMGELAVGAEDGEAADEGGESLRCWWQEGEVNGGRWRVHEA